MKAFIILLLIVFTFQGIAAQEKGKKKYIFKKEELKVPVPDSVPDMTFKTKLLPSLIIPAILIGYGLTTIKNNGIYSSYQAQKDIQAKFGSNKAPIDDYLIYGPYVEFAALILLKQKCKNDMVNTLLLIAKSEAIMWAMVYPLKYFTHVERPDGSDSYSFPSGHTSEAFVAATIVYREYRYKSVWYGIGAYALATTVGTYRMINNKHWESDVFVGAGIGMLSANLVYATHLHKWGRKEICVVPVFDGKNEGFAMTFKF